MRPKRSKQYKKLVQQFQLHHGFREPYQVLVDADLVRDAHRFTMDLQAGLERTLHGKVKIMITQCCMRHLYAHAREDRAGNAAVDLAKTFERRRCGHRPDTHAEPLSALECLTHVVDEKGRGQNKHRYVVASQDLAVRQHMRTIAGVPLIYINRSVMIMEPMSAPTAQVGAQAERAKFRSELRAVAGEKRKRSVAEEDQDDSARPNTTTTETSPTDTLPTDKKKKQRGPKGPNPLAVKKKKETQAAAATPATAQTDDAGEPKKRRKRKHKRKSDAASREGDADADDADDGGAPLVSADA